MSRITTLVLGTMLASCGCSLHDEAFDLAGSGARDCGHVGIGDNAKQAFACALDARDEGRAFVARFESQGIDSHVAFAWVGQSDGDVFRLSYDGDPSGGGGDSSPRIERFTCIGPSRRTLTENDLQSTSFPFEIAVGDDIIGCASETHDGVICE